MAIGNKQVWDFSSRFRRHAFGWRSSGKATQRIREAVSEIKKAARKNAVLGAEGAVLFLEKVSPAIEQVDSSSGTIGTAVNNAIDVLATIIANASASDKQREEWLDRLWHAVESDEIPYLETLPEHWGTMCVSSERASHWADELIGCARMALSPNPELRGYFKGTAACLSSLLKAGRHGEILGLLDRDPHRYWSYRKWGVKALLSMGRKAEALRYAERSRGLNEPSFVISQACEEILLASGLVEEAYSRYAAEANRRTTYLATFRSIAGKYPHKKAAEILNDLVAATPGNEGKWFAAAKSAGLYREAIELANRGPCDPRTLTRAARDMAETEPQFAIEAGLAALRWLVEGYGYEISRLDVLEAYGSALKTAARIGCEHETGERIRALIADGQGTGGFVSEILAHELWRKGQGSTS